MAKPFALGHIKVSAIQFAGKSSSKCSIFVLGTPPFKLVSSVVHSPYLLKDVAKLSPLHQTSGLETFHSLVNSFAPKSTHFFFQSMQAR